MNAKVIVLTAFVFGLVGSTARAGEWRDTNGDGYVDTLELDGFIVTDSDTSSFDWANYWEEQIRQEQEARAAELAARLDWHIRDFFDFPHRLIAPYGVTVWILTEKELPPG